MSIDKERNKKKKKKKKKKKMGKCIKLCAKEGEVRLMTRKESDIL